MSDVENEAAKARHAEWADANREEIVRIAGKMQAEKRTLAELVASGEYTGPLPLGVYQDYILAMQELRRVREDEGLSLADAAARCDIDKGSLSRLESGQGNPTFLTIGRYATSLGKRIRIVIEDLATLDPEPADASTPALAESS